MQSNKHIKNLLAEFEAEPSSGVWTNIKHQLKQDDKRKRRGFLFLLLLVTGGTALWYAGTQFNSGKKVIAGTEVSYNLTENNSHKSEVQTEITAKNSLQQNSGSSVDKNYIHAHFEEEKEHLNQSNRPLQTVELSNSNSRKTDQYFSSSSLHPASPTNAVASLTYMPMMNVGFIDITSPTPAMTSQQVTTNSKSNKLSRWQMGLYFGTGKSFRYYKSSESAPDEEVNLLRYEKAVTSIEAGLRLTYDINPRLAIRTGAGYFTSGMERNYTRVLVSGPADNQDYSIASSMGEVEGTGAELNQVFFNDPAVSLIAPNMGAGAGTNEDKVYKKFSFVQKFDFVSVPVSLVYKLRENIITPYVSLGASMNYFATSSFYVNDQKIHYSFAEKPNQWSVSALASAGLSFRVTKHFSIQAEPAYRHSITSLSSNKNKSWRPYSWTGNLNLNYRF